MPSRWKKLSQEIVVKTENLGKIYVSYQGFLRRKKVLALKNFNLEIKRGEIFGLLGLNAAGKTTVLKILLGFIKPSWGQFEVLGKRKIDTDIKRKLGYLPEEPKLYDFFSAKDFLVFCGKLFDLSKSDILQRTSSLLELVQISHASKRKIKEFSKGMIQRLAIVSALINEPEILFLDEPLSGLDPVGRKIIKEVLLDFKKREGTVLFSSHILAEVEEICDRVGILHQGELLCVRKIKSVLSDFPSLENFFLKQIGVES